MKTLNVNSILKSGKLQYKIEKVLGQGSFGITYLASTTIKVEGPLGSIETPVKVAIKEFFMRDINGREEGTVTCSNQNGLYDRYKEKFIKEAQNLSKLKHRHIIKVLEVFEANNTYYYVMEFCEGGSLDDEIAKRGTLSEEETKRYARQIADALGYMHDNKMLHLDLKPGNAMLRGDGDVVLIDFGLSKQYDENGQPESSTTIGGGTPGYAPLEQSNYDGKGFPKTMDIYALGGTMFKMLTGKRPPEASIILNYGFPSDELRQQGVSEQMICCIEKAMSFRVADRPQEVGKLLDLYKKPLSKSYLKSEEDTVINNIDSEETYIDNDKSNMHDNVSANKANDIQMVDGHGCVDLGLPSGLKWATCNVGANSSEENGHYYGWGETRMKSAYTENLCNSLDCDVDISGNAFYDAAKKEWGINWRIPTETEYKELLENCKFYTGNQNGTEFLLAVGPNGNQIKFPIAGYYEGRSRNSSCALYWSSFPKPDKKASCLYLGEDKTVCNNMLPRHYGACVRPVCGQKTGSMSKEDEKMLKREHGKGYWLILWFISLMILLLRLIL